MNQPLTDLATSGWHRTGLDGNAIEVAIIDRGFEDFTQRVAKYHTSPRHRLNRHSHNRPVAHQRRQAGRPDQRGGQLFVFPAINVATSGDFPQPPFRMPQPTRPRAYPNKMPTTNQHPGTSFSLRDTIGTSKSPHYTPHTDPTSKIQPLREQPGFLSPNCPASTIFAGWRQSVLPVHLLGLAPLLGSVGPVAGDVKLQDDGVVHDPVNRRGGGHGVGEDALPLREDQV